MKIKEVLGREILDSRGNPTISCTIILDNEMTTTAAVPSGASVGKHEAVELRDGDASRYNGLGVLKAIENIETVIAPALVGKEPDVSAMDAIMCELDGTVNKSKLGANAILGVSMAVVRAQALQAGVPLFQELQKLSGTDVPTIPKAMFNILNGGAHADNKIDFQEFMIMPTGQGVFSESLHVAVCVYHKLKELLRKGGYSTGVGDEGGFAPSFEGDSCERRALDFLCEATVAAGFEPGKEVVFCLDVAASHFYDQEEKKYILGENKLTSIQLIDEYKKLCDDYPIYSIEDGLDESDWKGWATMTSEFESKVMLVGDDIFVSNPERIERGVIEQVANAVLIKPNQIGTVTECLAAIATAKTNHYKTVVSHRSGETTDSFIADLAVGTNSGFIKAGAPTRGERVCKYNRLKELTGLSVK